MQDRKRILCFFHFLIELQTIVFITEMSAAEPRHDEFDE